MVRRIATGLAALLAGVATAVVASGNPLPFTVQATEGQGFDGDVATFTGHTCGPCSASITWGDGATSPGTVSTSGGPTTVVVRGQHTYAEEGAQSLTVNEINPSDSATNAVTVHDAPLSATAGHVTASSGAAFSGAVATFTDADPGGTASDYAATIDWGDGTATTAGAISGSGPFTVSGSHTYAAAGSFTVKVTITDAGGAGASASTPADVAASAPPVARFGWNPVPPLAGQTANFDAGASSGTGLTYSWAFCDGKGAKPCDGAETATGAHVQHVFPFASIHDKEKFPKGVDKTRRRSTFTVALTVTDSSGKTSSVSHEVTVMPDTPPVARFTSDANPIVGTHTATFTPDAFDPDPQDHVVEEDWDFSGDGVDDIVCKAGQVCQLTAKWGLPPSDKRLGGGGKARAAALPTQPGQLNPVLNTSCGHQVCLPPAFQPVPWNFGNQLLRQAQLRRLDSIDPFSAANPQVFLNDLAYELQFHTPVDGSNASTFHYPTKVRLRVRDEEGAIGATWLPVSLRGDDYPSMRMAYHPPDATKPLATGQDVSFDMGGTGDGDGKLQWYVMDAGAPTQVSSCVGANGQSNGTQGNGQNNGVVGAPPGGQPAIAKPKGSGQKLVFYSVDELLAGKHPPHYCTTDAFGIGPHASTTPQVPIITQNPADLHLAFNQPGTYAVQVEAYDDVGQASRARISGFKVVAAEGTCTGVEPQAVGDGSTGVSAECATVLGGGQFLWSDKPVNIDGLRLAPGPGGAVVIDNRNSNDPKLYSTTASAADAFAKGPTGAKAPVDVELEGTPVGRFASLQGELAQAILAHDGTDHVAQTADNATYRGLPVAQSSVIVRFYDGATSNLQLATELPAVFGNSSQPATTQVSVDGHNEPKIPVYTSTEHTGTFRRHHRRAVAHAAGVTGADTMDLVSSSIGDMQLGPMQFVYDHDTATWTGDGDLSIPGFEDLPAVKTHIVIKGTQLLEASGVIDFPDPGVAIGTGVFLTKVDFKITTDPLVITAHVHVNAIDVLEGDGTLRIQPSPFDLRFDGTATVAKLLPINAFVEVKGDGLISFGGNTAFDFGPASFSGTVAGALKGKQFYVEGTGDACLFVCLHVDELASSVGIAACGSVDLVLTTVSAGFGYVWGGSPSIFFDSCDLSGYKPDLGARMAATLQPGDSTTLKVAPNKRFVAFAVQGDTASGLTPSVTLTGPKGDKRVIATPAGSGDYGFSSAVGPVNPAARAAVSQQGTAMVDRNPLDATTTILVAKPTAGNWKLTVDQDSIPVQRVALADGLPPLTKKSVRGSVRAYHGPLKHAQAETAGVHGPAVPAIEHKRLRAVNVRVAKGAGRVTLVDRTAGGGGALLGTVKPGAKRDVAFDPPADGKVHKIIAVFEGPNGLPRGQRVVDTYRAPPPPKPPHITIDKLVRHGSAVEVLLSDGPADTNPNAPALVIDAGTQRGTHISIPLRVRDLKRRAGHWSYLLGGLMDQGKVRVSVRGAYRGRVAAWSTKFLTARATRVGP